LGLLGLKPSGKTINGAEQVVLFNVGFNSLILLVFPQSLQEYILFV